jgi:hypothetical protein
MQFNALSRAAFGCFLADILELGWYFVYDNLSGIAIHFKYFGAKINANLISGAEIFVYCDLHWYSFRFLILFIIPQGIRP